MSTEKVWNTPSGYSPYEGSVLAAIAEQPHWVYEVYAQDGTCLYIGMTSNLERRSQEQRRRFGVSIRIRSTEVPDRLEADRLESRRIRELRPITNRQRFGVPFLAEPARCACHLDLGCQLHDRETVS